mgnify:CR=1 FL=1
MGAAVAGAAESAKPPIVNVAATASPKDVLDMKQPSRPCAPQPKRNAMGRETRENRVGSVQSRESVARAASQIATAAAIAASATMAAS